MNRYYVETMVDLPEPSVSGKVAARVYHYIHAYSEEQVREMFKECKILEIFDHTLVTPQKVSLSSNPGKNTIIFS